jgi:hypothetical protein
MGYWGLITNSKEPPSILVLIGNLLTIHRRQLFRRRLGRGGYKVCLVKLQYFLHNGRLCFGSLKWLRLQFIRDFALNTNLSASIQQQSKMRKYNLTVHSVVLAVVAEATRRHL